MSSSWSGITMSSGSGVSTPQQLDKDGGKINSSVSANSELKGPNPGGTQQPQPQKQLINPSCPEMPNIPKMSSVRSSSVNNFLSRTRSGALKRRNALPITETDVADSEPRYSCHLCTSIIIGNANYVRHIKNHSKASTVRAQRGQKKAKFLCKECGQDCGSQELLAKHILTHSDPDAPRCTLCGKSCSTLSFLKSHYQHVHPNAPNPADQPTPSASFINGNLRGQNDANNDGNLKPIVIRKVITDENGVEESDEKFPNESDEPPNVIRPEKFMDIDANNMDRDETEYAPINSRSSKYLGNSGEIPPCDYCGKEFTNVKARSYHVWHCKNANIINCPVMDCPMKLIERQNIASHLLLHAEERAHPCRFCAASFPHKTEAHLHMKVIHNFVVKSRAYPCDFCDTYGFLTELELRDHVETVHNVALEDVFGDEEEFQGEDETNSYQQSYSEDEEGIPDPTSFLEQSTLPIQPPPEMGINSVSILKSSVVNPAGKQVPNLNQLSTSTSTETASKLDGNIAQKSWPIVGPPKISTATALTASSLYMIQKLGMQPMQESTMTLGNGSEEMVLELDEDDDKQNEMVAIEQMEFLQHDGEENSKEGRGESLQPIMGRCESCRAQVEFDKIAEHSCTNSEEETGIEWWNLV